MRRPLLLMLPLLLAAVAHGCTVGPASANDPQCTGHPLYAELMATETATLQVIVTLESEPAAQVGDLQDQLLSALDGTDHEVVRRYDNFPVLTLRVGAAALCRLLSSELVVAVRVDSDDPPTGG